MPKRGKLLILIAPVVVMHSGKRNKSALSKRLNQDFNKEITIAETCVYHDDFDGSLVANMINRTLKELEV